MQLDPNDLLTPSDAARVLGLSADSVRASCPTMAGCSAIRTVGGRRLFRRADVDKLAVERAGQVSHPLRTSPVAKPTDG